LPSLLIAVFAIVPVLTAAYDGGEAFVVEYWDQIKASVEKIKSLAISSTATAASAAAGMVTAAPASSSVTVSAASTLAESSGAVGGAA